MNVSSQLLYQGVFTRLYLAGKRERKKKKKISEKKFRKK